MEMIKFKNKFHLSPEQSLFLGKKKWDENVYCGMKMENRAVTFPQTQTILNGVNVPNVQLDDIQAILNMRDAWKFLLGTVNEEVTFEYWCKLNEYIARNEALEWGKLRTGIVGISGTDYEPPIPNKEKTIEELRLELWKKLDVKKDYTLLADKQRYVNHTYLKKFDAFGFTYDSESEQKHLFSSINQPVENEYILTSNNEFIPGVTLRRR